MGLVAGGLPGGLQPQAATLCMHWLKTMVSISVHARLWPASFCLRPMCHVSSVAILVPACFWRWSWLACDCLVLVAGLW